MSREKRLNLKLVKGLEQSLAHLFGDSGSEALLSLGKVPRDKFDPGSIDSSLDLVFGASPDGLSSAHKSVIEEMSTRLGVGVPHEPVPNEGSFHLSLESIAERYRLKEMTGFGFAGVVAGAISSICCLGPIALALLGFASLSASLSLAMSLTSVYQPVELTSALGFLGVTIFFQLRRKGGCNLGGLRRNLAYVIVPTTGLLVSYAVINYLIGVWFYGHPLGLLPWKV